MVKWLERQEKMLYHRNFVFWHNLVTSDDDTILPPTSQDDPDQLPPPLFVFYNRKPPSLLSDLSIHYTHIMPKYPTVSSVSFKKLQDAATGYGATNFLPALLRFIGQFKYPLLSTRQLETQIHYIILPFRSVPVFHKLRFVNDAVDSHETLDSVRASPRKFNKNGRLLHASRADVVLVRVEDVDLANPQRSAFQGMTFCFILK
jgi:hypothetical protein